MNKEKNVNIPFWVIILIFILSAIVGYYVSREFWFKEKQDVIQDAQKTQGVYENNDGNLKPGN